MRGDRLYQKEPIPWAIVEDNVGQFVMLSYGNGERLQSFLIE